MINKRDDEIAKSMGSLRDVIRVVPLKSNTATLQGLTESVVSELGKAGWRHLGTIPGDGTAPPAVLLVRD